MRKIISVILIIYLAWGFSACAVTTVDDGRLSVTVSVFPAYDFVRAIGGDKVNIHLLIDPGSSVHSYDPSPADIAAVSGSDLFIYNGGISDSWAEKIIAGTEVKRSFKMTDHAVALSGVDHDSVYDGHDHEHTYDEHIWTSPDNCVSVINAITEELCEIDGTNALLYRENANEYIKKIEEIDRDLMEFVKSATKNTIVVADKFPFHYLATHYMLGHVAVFETCNDQGDADAASIAKVIDTVKEMDLAYIYTVELTSGNIARSVCEQTGAQTLLLHSMQNVTKDDFTAGVTCVDLMKANAENLKKGLS